MVVDVVVCGVVLVINNPNSANRFMWKSFCDSTEWVDWGGVEEEEEEQRLISGTESQPGERSLTHLRTD